MKNERFKIILKKLKEILRREEKKEWVNE